MNNLFKNYLLKVLALLIVLILSNTAYSQEYIQSTFAVSANQVTVSIKSSNTISSGVFNTFVVDFRYLISDDPTFTVTNSSYSPVLIDQYNVDPNNPLYGIQRFGFSSGAVNIAMTAGTEYEVFKYSLSLKL